MSDSLWTFAFELVNFVTLAAVLAWLFFQPVRKALNARRAEARTQEAEAAQKVANAERLHADIESQRQALAAELEQMRVALRDAATREAAQIVAEARANVERERAALKREALHIEQVQAAKIARAVAAATRETTQRFLEQLDGPDLEQTLVKAACREFGTLAKTNAALVPVTVESAAPLDDQSRQVIDAALGEASRAAEFRIVPQLKGGLRITTAHGLIDASIAGLASFSEQSLSTELETLLREESADG